MQARKLFGTAVLLVGVCYLQAQSRVPAALTGDQIVERVTPTTVVILVGKGDGQVAGIASGVVIRPDGVILTAYHVVKGMREVQVRLKNGEIYDQAELIAADERRDVAALRIPAGGLPAVPVGNTANVSSGATVFVISNGAGLPWTATSGILSATRMADEVPGAGNGYRILQFTAPLAPGSSGGVLVDSEAKVLGIVVVSLSVGQNINFAVPIESVAGLANASGGTRFDSGARLQPPNAPVAASPARSAAPQTIPPAPPPNFTLPRPDQRVVRTVSLTSKTIFLRRERLQDDIRRLGLFQQLGLRFADYGEIADVAVTVDRPVMTYDWTYTLVYQPRSLTLSQGVVEAVDEFDAGPKLAAEIAEQLASVVMLPREALDRPGAPPASNSLAAARSAANDPVELLRNARTIFVESHTIWMKGNLLQDALYVRPEIREWGMRIIDDRGVADIYVDVTRPFLTYDWLFKMIHPKTGTVLGTGKVTAIDGPAAAQRLAIDIVSRIRSIRPVGTSQTP